MRMSITVLTAVAALLLPIQSKADSVRDPGGGFVGQKASKLGKNYYVVRKAEGCAIQTGKTGEKPEGTIGDAPYASKELREGCPQGSSGMQRRIGRGRLQQEEQEG